MDPQQQEFQITVTGEMLVALAEQYCLQYLAGMAVSVGGSRICGAFCINLATQGAQKTLREPLRSKDFRRYFIQYFENHVIEEVRTIAWPWLQDLLVWDADSPD